MLGLRNFKVILFCFVFSFIFISADTFSPEKFPYREAGLTRQHAAAILLDRFTFGPKPGEVDQVVKMGLERWFDSQLQGNLKDDKLNEVLKQYPTLSMTEDQILQEFPNPGKVIKQAKAEGVIPDSINGFNNLTFRKEIKKFAVNSQGMKLHKLSSVIFIYPDFLLCPGYFISKVSSIFHSCS